MILFGAMQMQTVKNKVAFKNRKLKFRPDAQKHMTYFSNRMKVYMDNQKIYNTDSKDDLPSFYLNTDRSIDRIVVPTAKIIESEK